MIARILFILALFVLPYQPAYADDAKALDNRSIPAGEDTVTATKTLTMADDGGEFGLSVGEIVKVELESQGGTGFSWYEDGLDERYLKLIKTEPENMAGKGMVGGPVMDVWYYKAVSSGDSVLSMLYYRVWEGSGKAVKKFRVKLHIK